MFVLKHLRARAAREVELPWWAYLEGKSRVLRAKCQFGYPPYALGLTDMAIRRPVESRAWTVLVEDALVQSRRRPGNSSLRHTRGHDIVARQKHLIRSPLTKDILMLFATPYCFHIPL